MKSKVLLLNPPSRIKYIRDYYCTFSAKADYYWPPQDLLILSGVLKQDHEIEVLDAVALKLTEEECLQRIVKSNAAALIFATGRASFESDIGFIERIKKTGDIKIIGSNSMFRFIGKEIMEKYVFLDVLSTDFTGKGVKGYLSGSGAGYSGIIYREDSRVCVSPPDEDGTFSCGVPLQGSFISRANHIPIFGASPFAIVAGSVGCSFSCKFCVAGQIKLKQRPLPEIIDELKYISAIGVKKVLFVDPIFTADKKRVFDFCAALKKENIGISWAVNGHAATLQDADMLKVMRQSGCRSLMIGVESANDDILKRYNKGTNVKQLKQAFRLCRDAGIKTLAYFIIGLPGEDRRSIERTIAFAKEIKCDYASFGYATADIGTELRQESLAGEWTIGANGSERLDSSAAPALQTDKLSEAESRRLLRRAYAQFYMRPGYIIKKIFDVRSIADIGILIKGGYALLKKNFS